MRDYIPHKVRGYREKVINALIDCVTMLYPLETPTIRREFTTSGVKLNANIEEPGDTLYAFGCPSVTTSICTIRAGRWKLSGGVYLVASATVTLAGSTEYVYTYHKKDHSASGFGHATSYPTGSADEWQVVLATFASTDAVIWVRSEINHNGDIPFYGPTA